MLNDGHNGRRGFAALLHDLVEESTMIIRDELKLAKIEVADMAKGIGKGTAFVATGAVFGLLGALALFTGIVLLIGDQWLAADLYWVAGLFVFVITGGIVAMFGKARRFVLLPV